MSLVTNNKVLIIFIILFIFNACNGQGENKTQEKIPEKIKSSENNAEKSLNYSVCDDHKGKLFFSIKKEKNNNIICVSLGNNEFICNKKILDNNRKSEAIDEDNIFTNCSKKGLEISHEYGGASPQGTYSFKINVINEKLFIDSIYVSEKLFLDDEVKVLSKGTSIKIPFNENVELTNEFKELYLSFFKIKHEFILKYIEKKAINKKSEWTIESTNLLENLNINKSNLENVNNIAFQLEQNGGNEQAIILLERLIYKFPNRVVAYLNLGDSYWNIDNKEKAKEFYQKYISLMKSQKKDLSKIPQRVYERTR